MEIAQVELQPPPLILFPFYPTPFVLLEHTFSVHSQSTSSENKFDTMPKLFGMNLRSLLFMPSQLDFQTDPVSGIPKANPHRAPRPSRSVRRGHKRSSSGESRTSGWLGRNGAERMRLGSMFKRLSRDSGSSKASSRCVRLSFSAAISHSHPQ